MLVQVKIRIEELEEKIQYAISHRWSQGTIDSLKNMLRVNKEIYRSLGGKVLQRVPEISDRGTLQ